MIPKIIHFCWLSDDKYPEKIRYCIESWKKFLPDYEILHIPADTRSAFPVISVQSPVSIQCCWQS